MEPTLTQKPLAVVTGASSGIGLELSRQFAQNGYDLIITANETPLAGVAAELEKLGAQVDSVQANLATHQGVEELYRQIKAKNRPLDSVAINAGVGVGGEFTETSLEEELGLINLNVISAVHLAKRIAKDMEKNGHGRILFTSSIAGVMPAPYLAVYGASKAFLYSFSEALRTELQESGVTVTALMPGPTDTHFFVRAHMEDTKVGQGEKDDPADVAQQGFEALMKGKDHVYAGSMSVKIQGAMAEILPKTLLAKRHAEMAEPGSATH